MRASFRGVLTGLVLIGCPAPAEAAIGVIPGVAATFPATADAPDVMVGATAFYEPLPWLVVRAGGYTASGWWHLPISVGYVLPQGGDFQLRPRLEVGLDPYSGPKGTGSNWHVGLGLDYLPWDDHWVIGSNVSLIWGLLQDATPVAGQAQPAAGPWLVRAELGVGYKF